MIHSSSPPTAARGFFRQTFRHSLLALAALAGFSASIAHAQYADWKASPPKILPNERVGSGAVFQTGSGRQFPNLQGFAALKEDGSISVWGASGAGGSGAPAGTGYRIQSVFYDPSGPGLSPTLGSLTASSAVIGGNVADDGGETLAERGVVYAETLTHSDPELGGTGVIQLVEDPAGTLGDYSFSLSGLPGNTATVSGLAITGATLGGTVVNDGGSGTITERGMVYALTSQNSNPQIGGSGVAKLTVAGTTGAFSRGLSGLTASSAYTFKVYATNANGTVYSSAVNFTTLGTNSAPGIFYDIPAVLNTAVAVSYTPVQIGSAVPQGSYLQVSNFAGSGTVGDLDATGTSATFKQPTGAAVDAAGNVYVADLGNHKIRKITPQGVVTTLAGDGYESFFYGRLKNANGTAASFNYPTDLAVDPAAQFVYVADKFNNVIRRVSLASPYAVTTFAGSSAGMVDSATSTAAKFDKPEGIAVDPTGTYLYVADRSNNRVRKITIASAAVATLAGSGSAGIADNANPLNATFNEPTGIAVDAAGNVYVTDFGGNKVRKIAVTAGVAGAVTTLGSSATFNGPYGVDVDGAGNVYVTEQTGQLIRMISPSGSVSTLAGVSGTAGSAEGIGLAATFNQPSGIAIHPNGIAYITHYTNAATGNKIRRINLTGYRLTGTLPAGLSFNGTTGVISGTPTGTQEPLAFTVSAWNYQGSASTTLTVGVSIDPVFPTAGDSVLVVSGFVAGGVLGDLSLDFVPAPRLVLTLVNNTGSSAISGTFAGLPERSVLITTVGGNTFHFQISYKGGTGNDITLTRSAGPGQVATSVSGTFPPILTTRGDSVQVTTTTATLNGTVNPNGFITTARFEYGTSLSYGGTATVTLQNPSNTTAQAVSADIVGLSEGTSYQYRLTATNIDGSSTTTTGIFLTDGPPAIWTRLNSAAVTATSASLGGYVLGDPAWITNASVVTARGVVYAEVGINDDPRIGGAGVTQVVGAGGYGLALTEVTGLTPNTEYCFRVYAVNSVALVYSVTGTFTSGAPVLPDERSLLDNTAGGTAGFGANGIALTPEICRGVAFTTGKSTYQLSSMRTAFGSGGAALSVALYAVDSALQPAGAAIFTKSYISQQFDAAAYYTWALPSVELAPETDYMLVFSTANEGVNWISSTVVPTSPAGWAFKSTYSSSNGQAWLVSPELLGVTLTGTAGPSAPTLAAAPISAHVTANTATLGGEVTTDGGAAITERGVVYAAAATNAAPQIGGAGVTRLTAVGTTGTFYLEVGSLAPETAYSVRAYATNSLGTSYSGVGTFATQPGLKPILTTAAVSGLSTTTATLNGTVNPNGFLTTARFEYGSTASYGSAAAVTLVDPANTTAQAVSVALVDLSAGTRYYYRLTATNIEGTSQTAAGTFWTDSLPSFQAMLYSNAVTATSASLGGVVSGGSLITGRGVVYAKVGINDDPTIGGSGVTQVSGTGTYGPFTIGVAGLTPDTGYCFRAYATNVAGLTYSNTGTFTSGAPVRPDEVTLLDNTAGGTAGTSNTGNGMSSSLRWGVAFTTGNKAYQLGTMRTALFKDLGALSVSLYAVDSGQQTIGEAIFTKSYVPQQFDDAAYYTWTLPQVRLKPDTSYMLVLGCVSGRINWMTSAVAPTSTAGWTFKSSYYSFNGQAWTDAGIRFGVSLTGTIPSVAPTLAAAPISAHVTATTATLGGEVTSDGGAAITERGVVYGPAATSPTPQIGGAGVIRLTAPGTTGTFDVEAGSLAPETAYSVRAYATNSLGTSYSEVGTFTTAAGVTRSHQQEWRFANFRAYDSANSGADAADPDGDGLNNLLEYALGLDPNTAGVMPAVLALNGASLEYTYTSSTAAKDNGVTYQIEWSDTLDAGSWSRETVSEQITSTEGALETVKVSIPAGDTGKRFLRLRVTAAGN